MMNSQYAYRLDDELTPSQKMDLDILMSLKTPEQRDEWIRAVDEDDFDYGMSLLTIAAYKQLEYETVDSDCTDANRVITRIKSTIISS